MPLKPRGGNLTTQKATTDVALSAGDMANLDADGKLSAIGAANTGRIVIAAHDMAIADEGPVWVGGHFLAPLGNDSGGAIVQGAEMYAKSATTFDAGSTGDRPVGVCSGPAYTNADGADVWVELIPEMPVKA